MLKKEFDIHSLIGKPKKDTPKRNPLRDGTVIHMPIPPKRKPEERKPRR
jgi:hypothetical protein